MTHSRQEIYWQQIESQIPRLLSQMDRRPFSDTYGCFDRKFWHQRFTHFPSASLQQGVESLAQLYVGLGPSPSQFKNSPTLLAWLQAAVIFTCKIQNRDGSYDEWYEGERGWAGPTAYILNSLFKAYQLTGHLWQQSCLEKFKKTFRASVHFLIKFEEKEVLANHQALAMLVVYQGYKLFDDQKMQDGYQSLFNRFLLGFNTKEGWSLEYDGADPGYQTATLSFLTRLYEINPSVEIKQLVLQQLEFIKYFVFPDGSFSESLGSRSTCNVFFYGIEYWAKISNLANALSFALTRGLEKKTILSPGDQEDHYLIYRLPEFFLAMQVAQSSEGKSVTLPYAKKSLVKFKPQSGFLFLKIGSIYLVVDSRFGGRYRAFDCRKNKLIAACGDIFFNGPKNQVFTTGCPSLSVSFQKEKNQLLIGTQPKKISSPVFNFYSHLGFQVLFKLLCVHPRISWLLKSLIRKKIMFSQKKSAVKIKKEIIWCQDKITILTQFSGVDKAYKSYNDCSRYVPQSTYFNHKELSLAQNIKTEPAWTKVISCAE